MKKNGFTIAEVLITLGIIGVVAALTIPQVTTETKKKLYANTLSVAVTDLETAMMTMTMREGVDTLYETPAWESDFLTEFKKVMPYKTTTVGTLVRNNLAGTSTSNISGTYKFATKKGVAYYITTKTDKIKSENEIMLAGGHLTSVAADIYIDVNTDEKPNTIGRDTFRYVLGADGHIYPYGGKDYTIYNGSTYSAGQAETECKINKNGAHCAAYLAENGYRMDY